MAETPRGFYPRIIINDWWDLRNKLKETPDFSMTPKNIAEYLEISISTVFSNIYTALKQFDIIDRIGNLTKRGRKWLKDQKYKEVCLEIIESIYPVELIDSIKDPLNNQNEVNEWFSNKTEANENIIFQMASTYLLLCKGDPDEVPPAALKKAIPAEVKPSKPKGPKRKYKLRKAKPPELIPSVPKEFEPSVEFEKVIMAMPLPVEPKLKREYKRKIKPESPVGQTISSGKDDSSEKVLITERIVNHEVTDKPQLTAGAEPKPEQIIISETEQQISKEAKTLLSSRIKPNVNINIHLTITSGTKSEQIITLFTSIGKYLVGN